MRKLIELGAQDYVVVCDNENCDYKVENTTKDPLHEIDKYLDVPCPECGENLLTKEDLDTYMIFIKSVNFMNKWFSWLTIFIPRRKYKSYSAHAHKGLKISEDEKRD